MSKGVGKCSSPASNEPKPSPLGDTACINTQTRTHRAQLEDWWPFAHPIHRCIHTRMRHLCDTCVCAALCAGENGLRSAGETSNPTYWVEGNASMMTSDVRDQLLKQKESALGPPLKHDATPKKAGITPPAGGKEKITVTTPLTAEGAKNLSAKVKSKYENVTPWTVRVAPHPTHRTIKIGVRSPLALPFAATLRIYAHVRLRRRNLPRLYFAQVSHQGPWGPPALFGDPIKQGRHHSASPRAA